MLDTIHAIETPEGVELGLRLSGIPARMLAWIIDSFIRLGLYIALSVGLAWADEFGLPGEMLRSRFYKGWSHDRILTTPRDIRKLRKTHPLRLA